MSDQVVVIQEVCEAKHGELMRSMSHIEGKVDEILTMLHGNGKPGFRETQNNVAALQKAVEALKEDKEEADKHKENMLWGTFWNFVKPALPLVYGLALYLLWFALDHQFGAK